MYPKLFLGDEKKKFRNLLRRKAAGLDWMRKAEEGVLWRYLEKAYV